MDTGYKTRGFWILQSLEYAESYAGANVHTHPDQLRAWGQRAVQSAANALAPAGAECLTRRWVDKQGNLLPCATFQESEAA